LKGDTVLISSKTLEGLFLIPLLFKVAITTERVNYEKSRGIPITRDCTHLYDMIYKNCGSLEEHRILSWTGGVVVSTVREAVFLRVEACSVSVAFSWPAAGLICLVLCSAFNWAWCWTVPAMIFFNSLILLWKTKGWKPSLTVRESLVLGNK
jgi:hypothetical protein